MNKKGLGFPSITTVFITVMILIVLIMAQKGGFDNSNIDKTIDSLNWSKYNQNITNSMEIAKVDKPYYFQVIISIAEKAVDFFGYSVMEVSKLAMKITAENPDIINYKVLFTLLILFLLSPVLYPIFIIIVCIVLLVREYLLKRKEEKEIKTLQGRSANELENNR